MQSLALDEPMERPAWERIEGFQFGGSEDFAFDFTTVTASMHWPGPAYDENARFAPGVLDKPRVLRPRGKSRSPKRKLSHQDNTHSPRSTKQPQVKAGSDSGKHEALSRPIQYYGGPPRRDEPIHLLTLPGEIRNQIYRIMTVSRNPLIAQFKPIVLPRRGREDSRRVVIRRFPREPVLALGNRQLRDEVLSTFYSGNRFLIRQTDNPELQTYSLFLPPALELWTPKWNMAASLTHMEVHFNARLSFGGKHTSDFVLRRFANGTLQIEHHTEIDAYCMCFDERVAGDLHRIVSVEARESRDLVYEIGAVIRERRERLQADEGMVQTGYRFRPKGLSCEECEREHLRMLEDGL